MQERFKFFAPVQVRYADTDAQGHVFFSNYLIYFDISRTEYFKAIEYPYDQLLQEGVDFFEVESLCQYKGRAYFDEILHVHTRISHIGNTSFKTEFSIFEETSDRFICTGHLVGVTVDTQTQRPVPVPQGLRDAVRKFEEGGEG
jgi:acyl-CoA thioester hydrolase